MIQVRSFMMMFFALAATHPVTDIVLFGNDERSTYQIPSASGHENFFDKSHHQSTNFNFKIFPTRFLDVSIASEASDSSHQLQRLLIVRNAQNTTKSIQSNSSASIKIASQFVIGIGFQNVSETQSTCHTFLMDGMRPTVVDPETSGRQRPYAH